MYEYSGSDLLEHKFKFQYTYVNSFGLAIFAPNAYVCTEGLDSLSIHCIQTEYGSWICLHDTISQLWLLKESWRSMFWSPYEHNEEI
jgi:hypothetical protein